MEDGHGNPHPEHTHESPPAIIVPLMILAIPSIAIGWVNLGGGFGEFVEGALPAELRHFEFHIDAFVLASSMAFALGGIGLATAIYYAHTPSPESLRQRFRPLHALIERKYFMDDIAEDGIVRGFLNGGIGRASQLFDTYVVDGVVNGVAFATRLGGDMLRRTIAGQPQAYTSVFVLGVVALAGALFVLRGDALQIVGLQ